MFIPDPGSGFFPIPDPGIKNLPDPGSATQESGNLILMEIQNYDEKIRRKKEVENYSSSFS
jgi:hypothetical protein